MIYTKLTLVGDISLGLMIYIKLTLVGDISLELMIYLKLTFVRTFGRTFKSTEIGLIELIFLFIKILM